MFERRLSRARLYELILYQRDRIQDLEAQLRENIVALEQNDLRVARSGRDLLDHFLVALDLLEEGDLSEETLRDGLEAGLEDLRDHVARLEEHV
jgi:chromosome condensin MukBEF ATPase and DNA-binding subunit MukB